MRSGSISGSTILRRLLPGKVVGREEVASTCSVARVRVVVLNFTLFKESTIEATRERKVTPRPHPPPSLGELYKDLNNFEWQGRTIPLTDPLTTAMRIQPFSQLLFDTVLETRTFRAPERPHARPIKPLEDDTISLRIVRSNQRGNPYIRRFPLDHFFVVILIISLSTLSSKDPLSRSRIIEILRSELTIRRKHYESYLSFV